MRQIVTKFGILKIDNGGETVMSSDAVYYHTIYGKLTKLSSSYIGECSKETMLRLSIR